MKRIEAGMLVRVIETPPFNPRLRWVIGHIGRVLRECEEFPGDWIIEGIEVDPVSGRRVSINHVDLRPVPDDHDTTTWDEIQRITRWHPQTEVA